MLDPPGRGHREGRPRCFAAAAISDDRLSCIDALRGRRALLSGFDFQRV